MDFHDLSVYELQTDNFDSKYSGPAAEYSDYKRSDSAAVYSDYKCFDFAAVCSDQSYSASVAKHFATT